MSGWGQGDSNQNRYFLVSNLNSNMYVQYRDALYLYHFEGLDLMHKDLKTAKEKMIEAITQLSFMELNKPNSFLTRVFFDAKSDEIVSIFTGAPNPKPQTPNPKPQTPNPSMSVADLSPVTKEELQNSLGWACLGAGIVYVSSSASSLVCRVSPRGDMLDILWRGGDSGLRGVIPSRGVGAGIALLGEDDAQLVIVMAKGEVKAVEKSPGKIAVRPWISLTEKDRESIETISTQLGGEEGALSVTPAIKVQTGEDCKQPLLLEVDEGRAVIYWYNKDGDEFCQTREGEHRTRTQEVREFIESVGRGWGEEVEVIGCTRGEQEGGDIEVLCRDRAGEILMVEIKIHEFGDKKIHKVKGLIGDSERKGGRRSEASGSRDNRDDGNRRGDRRDERNSNGSRGNQDRDSDDNRGFNSRPSRGSSGMRGRGAFSKAERSEEEGDDYEDRSTSFRRGGGAGTRGFGSRGRGAPRQLLSGREDSEERSTQNKSDTKDRDEDRQDSKDNNTESTRKEFRNSSREVKDRSCSGSRNAPVEQPDEERKGGGISTQPNPIVDSGLAPEEEEERKRAEEKERQRLQNEEYKRKYEKMERERGGSPPSLNVKHVEEKKEEEMGDKEIPRAPRRARDSSKDNDPEDWSTGLVYEVADSQGRTVETRRSVTPTRSNRGDYRGRGFGGGGRGGYGDRSRTPQRDRWRGDNREFGERRGRGFGQRRDSQDRDFGERRGRGFGQRRDSQDRDFGERRGRGFGQRRDSQDRDGERPGRRDLGREQGDGWNENIHRRRGGGDRDRSRSATWARGGSDIGRRSVTPNRFGGNREIEDDRFGGRGRERFGDRDRGGDRERSTTPGFSASQVRAVDLKYGYIPENSRVYNEDLRHLVRPGQPREMEEDDGFHIPYRGSDRGRSRTPVRREMDGEDRPRGGGRGHWDNRDREYRGRGFDNDYRSGRGRGQGHDRDDRDTWNDSKEEGDDRGPWNSDSRGSRRGWNDNRDRWGGNREDREYEGRGGRGRDRGDGARSWVNKAWDDHTESAGRDNDDDGWGNRYRGNRGGRFGDRRGQRGDEWRGGYRDHRRDDRQDDRRYDGYRGDRGYRRDDRHAGDRDYRGYRGGYRGRGGFDGREGSEENREWRGGNRRGYDRDNGDYEGNRGYRGFRGSRGEDGDRPYRRGGDRHDYRNTQWTGGDSNDDLGNSELVRSKHHDSDMDHHPSSTSSDPNNDITFGDGVPISEGVHEDRPRGGRANWERGGRQRTDDVSQDPAGRFAKKKI
jgi:hypothetical protein